MTGSEKGKQDMSDVGEHQENDAKLRRAGHSKHGKIAAHAAPEGAPAAVDEGRGPQGAPAQEPEGIEIPSLEELQGERDRRWAIVARRRIVAGVLGLLVTVAVVSALVVTWWVPVLNITSNSMEPTLRSGDMVACSTRVDCQPGDVVAVRVQDHVLVKRVIATGGHWVDMDEDGNVYVDGELVDEPYVEEKAVGNCDITLPYEVPENCLFVMGDNRSDSLDSRSIAVGCPSRFDVMCMPQTRFWPLNRFGGVS